MSSSSLQTGRWWRRSTISAQANTSRSEALVSIAKEVYPHSTVMADVLHLPHPVRSFDFAISIAVIHHLSTQSRRIEAIRSTLQLLRPADAQSGPGKLLLFVWALEQETSRRGWGTQDSQDVLVPWILKKNSVTRNSEPDAKFDRFYHLYRKGELENDIAAASGTVLESGYEKDNWWAICCPA